MRSLISSATLPESVESLFKTAKYRPEFPACGFADLEAVRAWG